MYAVNSPDGERPDISAETLARKIPDVERHDVFLCGPPGFAQSVYEALRGAGSPLAVSTTSRSRCERRTSGVQDR